MRISQVSSSLHQFDQVGYCKSRMSYSWNFPLVTTLNNIKEEFDVDYIKTTACPIKSDVVYCQESFHPSMFVSSIHNNF